MLTNKCNTRQRASLTCACLSGICKGMAMSQSVIVSFVCVEK